MAKIEINIHHAGLWLELGQKRENNPLWQGFGKNKDNNRGNTIFGRAFVRVRAQIEETPFLIRICLGKWLKIEKNKLFGRALVRIRAKIEKIPFLQGLWLE